MAVVELQDISTLLKALNETDLANKAASLAASIKQGIESYGTATHPVHGKIYAYGKHLSMLQFNKLTLHFSEVDG